MRLKLFFVLCSIILLNQIYANELLILDQPGLFSCEDMQGHLKQLLEQNPNKNFVFYVHGRGKHPQKAFSYLPEFQSEYNVVTMMFAWDSWSNWYTRPTENALAVAPRLITCLGEFQKFKEQNKTLLKNRLTHFILHSMGNIILKEILENYPVLQLDQKLFDSIILNAADVPSKNHNYWLQKLQLSKKVYVTLNGDDIVLAASRHIDFSGQGSRRLGTRFEDPVLWDFDASIKFYYLDFDKLSFLGHRHFFTGDGSREKYVTQIYRYLLTHTAGDFPVKYKASSQYPNHLIFETESY
ncbi:MAG: hypothetical protein A2202_00345 [Bdellovibrionales bacterium RIFOXYA1_FULL_36_14]|nr:MAG: hypothetical protein A2202_00345 [Bdellovibrionales bacterium RIFOXYA1_FULL_36_14]